MRRSVVWVLAASVVLLQASVAGQTVDPAEALGCRVVGLRVVGDTGTDPDTWDWEMMPFGERMGTTLVLAVISRSAEVVPLATAVAQFRAFRDSAGTDQAAPEPDEAALEYWELNVGLNPASPKLVRLMEVRAGSIPAAGSRSIQAEGTLAVVAGMQPAAARQEAVPLRKGTRITAGPVPFEITEVTVADAADAPAEDDMSMAWPAEPVMTVTLEAREALGQIAYLEMLDADDKPIQWTSQGSDTSLSFADDGTPSTEGRFRIGLPQKRETVTVVVHYYGEVRKVELPFAIDCGVVVESLTAP